MAVACTIRRNTRSFYRRVHVDKLATPHSLDLMNVISRLYGDTMPLIYSQNIIPLFRLVKQACQMYT